MHVDTPGQDTQNNWPVGASGFGLGTFAHPDPDALAPAGTASAVAVTATDTMTAKKTRNRTGRMGPPLPAPGCQSAAEVTGPYTCTSRLVNGDEWTISIGTRRARQATATVSALLVRWGHANNGQAS